MFDTFYVSILCVLSPVFLLGVSFVIWKDVRCYYKNNFIPDVIFFFVAYKLLAYFLLPALLRIFSSYQYVNEDEVSLLSLAQLYGIEVVSYVVWLFTFSVVVRLVRVRGQNEGEMTLSQKRDYFSPRWNESLVLIFICLGFITYSLSIIFGFNNVLFTLFRSLFVYGGMVGSIYLLVLGSWSKLKLHVFVGTITLLFSLSYIQSRGALVYGLIWLIFLLAMFRMKKALYIGLGFFICIVVLTAVFNGLPKLGFIDPDTGQVSLDLNVDDEKSAGRSLLDDIEWRFGANTRMSTSFIEMYDRGDSAGINPIKHSFLGFLPRSLNPDKPHPSTLDPKDIYSQGMYLIYREIHGYGTYSMVEFSTGGHFYWEFGFLGVILLSAISACYVVAATMFFEKFGAVGIPLVVMLFKPWGYMNPKIWISDAILQIYQIIMPLLLLYFLFWILPRVTIRKRRHSGG